MKRRRNGFQSTLVRRPFKRPRRRTRISARQRGFVRIGGNYGRYRVTGGESKFFETNLDDSVVAQNWNVEGSLNLIPQGVTETQRVGRKCTITNIGIRITAKLPTTAVAAQTADILRIALVQDKQANGANPGVTDVFEDDNYQSFNNLSNSGRFKTLWDKTISISASAGSGRGSTDTLSYGEVQRAYTFFKRCNIPIEFDSTTGAVTEIRSNNIVLLYASKNGFAGFDGVARIRFTDR